MIINFVFDNFYGNGQPKNNLRPCDNYNDGQAIKPTSSNLMIYWEDTLPILNRTSFKKSNHTVKFISTSEAVNNHNTEEKYIYLIELTAIEYYTMWPLYYIPGEIANLVDNDRCKLVISHFSGFPMLCYGAEAMYKNIHQASIVSGIKNLDNIILIMDVAGDITIEFQNGINHMFANIDNTLYNYLTPDVQALPRRGVPRIVESGTWEWMLNERIFQNKIDYLSQYLQHVNKTHSYLFLNNTLRPHRYMMYKATEYLDIKKDSLYSFRNADTLDNYKNDWDSRTIFTTTDDAILSDEVLNFKEYLQSNPIADPVFLDNDTAFSESLSVDNFLDTILKVEETNLINTWFSLVTETGFLSEKTFKLIYYGHPFILVGLKGLIKQLKLLGYKTFDCIFDESYDDMLPTPEKILFIANQVKQYCGEEGRRKISEKLPEIEAILRYNRELFMTKDYNEFWAKL